MATWKKILTKSLVASDISSTGIANNKFLQTLSNGTLSWAAVSASDTYVDEVGFNTSTGVLTISRNDDVDVTKDLDGRYALSGTNDNYQNWKLLVDGVQKTSIGSTDDHDLVGGTGISLAYSAGGVVTITNTVSNTNTNQLTTFVVRDDDNDDETVSQGKFIKFVSSTGVAGTNLTGGGTTSDPYVMTIQNPDTVYTHPTTAGNKHIPTGGSAGLFLKYSSSGTAVWAADNNTVYTHPTSNGNKHVPADGSAGKFLGYSGGAGAASWQDPPNTNQLTTWDVHNSQGTKQWTTSHNDAIKFVAGSNVSVTFDTSNKLITIAATDTNTDTKWSGGTAGLTASTGRTSLGLGTMAVATASDYATIASPTLTGTPAAPTAAANTNTTQVATTAYVQTELSDLVNSAPGTLDTLGEIADALNDSNVNVWTAGLDLKANLSGASFTGKISASVASTQGSTAVLDVRKTSTAHSTWIATFCDDNQTPMTASTHDHFLIQADDVPSLKIHEAGANQALGIAVGDGNGTISSTENLRFYVSGGHTYNPYSGMGGDLALTINTNKSADFTSSVSWSGGSSANANIAFSERTRWDGGSADLSASNGRSSLGLGSMATQNTGSYATGAHSTRGSLGLDTDDSPTFAGATLRSTSTGAITLPLTLDNNAGEAGSGVGIMFDHTDRQSRIYGVRTGNNEGLDLVFDTDSTDSGQSYVERLRLSEDGRAAFSGTLTWSGGGSANANTAYTHSQAAHLALGATSSTAYRGDRGTTAYDHSQASHAPTNAQANPNSNQIWYAGTQHTSSFAGWMFHITNSYSGDGNVYLNHGGGYGMHMNIPESTANTYFLEFYDGTNQKFYMDGTGKITTGVWQATAIADSYISSSSNWNTAYTVANAALPKAGGTVTGTITLSSGNIIPSSDNTRLLGTDGAMWDGVWTNEINATSDGTVYLCNSGGNINVTGNSQFGSTLYLSGKLARNGHSVGHLEGSYNNVGANSTKSNPIYTIGSSYNPTDTGLSNMYGVGYSHSNWSPVDDLASGADWGFYVAADGDIRVYLDGGSGQITTASHGNSSQWNTAYGWGNHASAGYITSQTDSQTLSISGHTITISGSSSSVVVPDNNTQLSTAEVRGKISASGNSSYNSTTGVITSTDTNTNQLTTWDVDNGSGTRQFTVSHGEGVRFVEGSNVGISFDQSNEYITFSSTDTNTTYSVGDGGLTAKNFTATLKTKLDGIAASANNYSPSCPNTSASPTFSANTRSLQFYTGGWYRNDNSKEGLYNQATGQHWYSDNDDYWNVAGGGSANGIRFRDDHDGTIRGYVYANNSNQCGILNESGGWVLQCSTGTARVYGNIFLDQNYGNSLIGLYSANRYQGIFAMGESYKLADNGQSSGTLYGIAWTHSNIGGESKSGLNHQMVLMQNGTTSFAAGTGMWTSGVITTTSNIVVSGTVDGRDVASDGSKLDGIAASANNYSPTCPNSQTPTFSGAVTATNFYAGTGWYRNTGTSGLLNSTHDQHFYADANYWNLESTNGMVIKNGTTTKGYIYHDGNGFGMLASTGSWWLNTPNNEKYLCVGGSQGNNPYNSTTGIKLLFGSVDSDAYNNYYIGTNMENYGGNYTKLDLRWHTGIRMGAHPNYGGVRIYDHNDLGTVLMAIGAGNAHVNITNNLTIGGTVDGRDVASDGSKLDGIASGANAYTHPTSNGNKHVPSDGSAGQFLGYSGGAGAASWQSPPTEQTIWDVHNSQNTKQFSIAHGDNIKIVPGSNVAVAFDSGNKLVTISATDTDTNTWRGLGTTSSTGFRGDYGNTAYNHSQAAHAPSNAITATDSHSGFTTGTHTGAVTQGDSDVSNNLGRCRVGYIGHSDYAGFSHRDRANGSEYAMIQSTTGNTFINTTGTMYFRRNNTNFATYDSNSFKLLVSNCTFHVGSPSWGGAVSLQHNKASDVQFLFFNESTTGYGGKIKSGPGNSGHYILRMSDRNDNTKFSFYTSGSSSPSGMSDSRNKMNIDAFGGDALANMKWLSPKLKTFRFNGGLEGKEGEEPTAHDLDDSYHVPLYKDNWHSGFIAQDILESSEQSVNNLVHSQVDRDSMSDTDRYYLDYEGLTSQLVRAIVQLEARIAALES